MTIFYRKQNIALTTKHQKENAIAPHFRDLLGATLLVPQIDTDVLGTFSGEIERKGNALETAIQKARLGMQATNLSYGLASEGSFGPHPYIPLLSCDNELLVFIDDERGFHLHEMLISEETNYAHACVSTLEQAHQFLNSAKFPSHGVILRPNDWQDHRMIFKDAETITAFNKAFDICKLSSSDGQVWLETDMRAHRNPSRMSVIATLAEKLARRLATPCPSCAVPGWGKTGVYRGLECEMCRTETEMVKADIFSCVMCDYSESKPRLDGLWYAPQEYCPYCNP
jgi:hypothetical protein